jgi:hypothetical protein
LAKANWHFATWHKSDQHQIPSAIDDGVCPGKLQAGSRIELLDSKNEVVIYQTYGCPSPAVLKGRTTKIAHDTNDNEKARFSSNPNQLTAEFRLFRLITPI